MKTFLILAAVVAAAVAVVPREVLVEPHPRHTMEEWESILGSQSLNEEVCLNCKPAVEIQSATAGRSLVDTRIVGGQEAVPGQFPWQVALYLDGTSFCGGSLISNKVVLTAGHCASGIRQFRVILGSQYVTDASKDEHRETIIATDKKVHSGYDASSISNDIAIVKLPREVTLSGYINIIRLPSASDAANTFVGLSATVSGWGKTSDYGSISPSLQFVQLPIMPNTECARYFGQYVRASNICGDSSNAHSTCNGDSGGPLIVKGSDNAWKQVGIVSYGSAAGCAKGYPSVFTRVSSYLKWIADASGVCA